MYQGWHNYFPAHLTWKRTVFSIVGAGRKNRLILSIFLVEPIFILITQHVRGHYKNQKSEKLNEIGL